MRYSDLLVHPGILLRNARTPVDRVLCIHIGEYIIFSRNWSALRLSPWGNSSPHPSGIRDCVWSSSRVFLESLGVLSGRRCLPFTYQGRQIWPETYLLHPPLPSRQAFDLPKWGNFLPPHHSPWTKKTAIPCTMQQPKWPARKRKCSMKLHFSPMATMSTSESESHRRSALPVSGSLPD